MFRYIASRIPPSIALGPPFPRVPLRQETFMLVSFSAACPRAGRPENRRLLLGGLLATGLGLALWSLAAPATAGPTGCSVYWTGASSTSWTVDANWSTDAGGVAPGHIPLPSERACLATTPIRAGVVYASLTRAVAGIDFSATATVRPSLQIDGGVLTVGSAGASSASVINDLSVRWGGVLTGQADILLTGSPALADNSVLAGPGTTTLAADTAVSVESLILDDGRQLRVEGSLTHAGCHDYVYLYDGAVLDNAGQLTAASTCDLRIFSDGSDGSMVRNEPGATIRILQDATDTYSLDARLDNRGLVELSAGTLITRPLSTQEGAYDVPAGAQMLVALGGTLHVEAGTWIGAGDIVGWGGTVDVAAGVTLENLQMAGSTLSGDPTLRGLTATSGLRFVGGGTLTLAAGAPSTIDGLTVDGGSIVVNRGALSHDGCFGSINLRSGSVLRNEGTLTAQTTCASGISSDGSSGTSFDNTSGGQFVVTLARPLDVYSVDARLDNQGSLEVTKGVVRLPKLANLADGRLSGGAYTSTAGTIELPAGIVTNAAALNVTTGGNITDPSGASALRRLTTNAGTLTVSRALTIETDLLNTGTVTVTQHNVSTRTYTQTGGTTSVSGLLTTTVNPGGMTISGGTVTGDGRVSGLVGGGTVRPTGELAVSSTYEQDASGTLALTLGPVASAPRLAVQGKATLGGRLSITTQPGFTPVLGSTYTILTANAWEGTFTGISGQSLPAGLYYDIAYTPDGVRLTVAGVPELTVDDQAVLVGGAGPTPMTFTVRLSEPTSRLVSVDYATVDGTATAGSDYVRRSGTLTFAPGVTELPLVVTISADTGFEPVERFTLALSAPDNAVLATASATGTITHDGAAPTLPQVTGVAPDAVGLGALEVDRTVTGENFLPTTSVTLTGAGLRLDRTRYVDAENIVVTVSATSVTTVGAVDVTVSTPLLGTDQCLACLQVTPRPSPTAAGPALATGATSRTVTVTGTDFRPGSTVKLTGGSGVSNTSTYVSPTTIQLTVTVTKTASLGPRDVRVTNVDDGFGICTGCFQVIGGPTLTGMSPSTVARGSTQTVSFTGSRFATGATLSPPPDVSFANVRVVNSTTLTATMTVSDTRSKASEIPITVVNGAGGGYGSVTCSCLTVTTMITAPNATAAVGTGGSAEMVFDVQLDASTVDTVTVAYRTADESATAGTDYTARSGTLTFAPRTILLQVRIPILADSGPEPDETFRLVLSSPVNAALATPSAVGTIHHDEDAVPAPRVTGVSPNTVGPGASDRQVTVTGSAFQPNSTVSVSGTGVSVVATNVLNSASIRVTLSAWATATAGVRDVTVTTPVAGASTCTGCLRVTPAPVTTRTSTSLGTGATEREVTVTGTGFAAGAVPKFTGSTGVAVVSSQFVSATSLKVTLTVSQTARTGAYDVRVTNPDGGTALCTGCFSVTAGPTVASLTPPIVLRGTTTPVTILGSHFANGASVVGPAGVTFSNVIVLTQGTITATMRVDLSASRGNSLPITVLNPASAGWGQGTCKCLGITI